MKLDKALSTFHKHVKLIYAALKSSHRKQHNPPHPPQSHSETISSQFFVGPATFRFISNWLLGLDLGLSADSKPGEPNPSVVFQ